MAEQPVEVLHYLNEAHAVPGAPGGDVRFTLCRPDTDAPVPVLIILAGIKTGHQTLERLPPPGNNAVIAYAYPYDRERWLQQSTPQRALVAYRMSHDVRGQVEVLLRWVASQPWADAARINIAGGSLGAIVLPMILRHVQARGLFPRTAVFAYGGANRLTLGYLSLRHRGRLLAGVTGMASWALLGHLEPARHLRHLRGEFLAVSSPEDELVPARCSNLLEELLPEPKTIVHLKGDHVDATNPALLTHVVEVARAWMRERGALN